MSVVVGLLIAASSSSATSVRSVAMGQHRVQNLDDSAMVGGSLYLLGRDAKGRSRLYKQETPGAATVDLEVSLKARKGARLVAAQKGSEAQLYVVGGEDAAGPCPEFERIDLTTLQVTSLASLPHPRTRAGVVVMDSRLYVAGGRHSWGTVADVDVYDFNSQQWRMHAPLLQARECELVVFDNQVFALGGYANKAQGVVRFIERLGFRRNVVTGEMPVAVSRYGAMVDVQGRVVVVGDFVNVTQVLRFPLPTTSSLSFEKAMAAATWVDASERFFTDASAPIAPRRGGRVHGTANGPLVVGGQAMGRQSVRLERLVFDDDTGPLALR